MAGNIQRRTEIFSQKYPKEAIWETLVDVAESPSVITIFFLCHYNIDTTFSQLLYSSFYTKMVINKNQQLSLNIEEISLITKSISVSTC